LVVEAVVGQDFQVFVGLKAVAEARYSSGPILQLHQERFYQ
jgi:hypothetical protein